MGAEIEEGSYRATATPGSAKVVIRVPVVVGWRPDTDPNRPRRPIMRESLPPRFNSDSELVIEVLPNASVHNFDLSSS